MINFLKRVLAILMCVVGGAICFVFAIALVVFVQMRDAAAAVIVGIFAALGLVLFIYGVMVFRRNKKVVISNDTVTSAGIQGIQKLSVSENESTQEMLSVVCASCGGVNQMPAGTSGVCDYCGSPING